MEWAVASACLESCVLGEECIILLFQKEYAGLRVKASKYTAQVHVTRINTRICTSLQEHVQLHMFSYQKTVYELG